ncbi:hypothetical protein H8R18_03140 [Nanchangia anserum]|uniref:Uncharacterized protein n=1 Tax=Nanchangia anserum TaxID=2692125 RepID=A0A8I0GG64_9ACTO|nr:hypothetical protein [Nanchangia anserum]MBD3690222.1 hypothetical protein [Nanchangia anserum]QOX82333.1 hypothetical protein H8R18_03140 [Nanchangia anserum]
MSIEEPEDADIDFDAELEQLIREEKVRARPGGVAVVLTPVREADDLAALLGLGGIDAEVMATSSGTLVWFRLGESEYDEFDALLGDDRPVPDEVDAMARKISAIVAPSVVVMVSWLEEGDVEPGVSGQITARRYAHGEPGDALPAGLLLSSGAPEIEDLLLGRVTPDDLETHDHARSHSKLQAMKHLGRIMRRRGRA